MGREIKTFTMKTGVFTMPMPDYLAEHGVSQSQLKKIARSPAHLKYHVEHPEPTTPDQVIGTITHTAVFETTLLETCCYMKPSTYENGKGEKKKWNGNATECKYWLETHSNKPIIPQADFSAILMMRDAVANHPAAAMALKTGKAEQSLFCEDADTGLQLKCRCDWLSGNAIVDLKTCQDASEDGFSRQIANFGYDIQAAYNLDICTALGLGKEHFLFIAVEKDPPYAVAVKELDEQSIQDGRSKYRRLLSRYLECVVADKWPGYSSNIEIISLPAYAKRRELNAMLLADRPTMPALEVA